jgi:pyruvate dehydrogenase E1 component alpha subunit
MDVLAVRDAAQKAIARARAGDGPTLIECLTYRFRGHSLADPDELRDREEKEFWEKRDPLKMFAKFIIDRGLATETELKTIEKKVQEIINDAVDFAEKSPEPSSDELYRFVFAEDE